MGFFKNLVVVLLVAQTASFIALFNNYPLHYSLAEAAKKKVPRIKITTTKVAVN
jgi:hypothetical protein